MASQPPAAKMQKLRQKFREDYARTWPFISRSKLGEAYAYCTICSADIKIECGGRTDLERHIKSPKHESRAKSKVATPSVMSLFSKQQGQPTSLEQKTTNAELLFTNFLVEHNLPLAITDHAGELFRKMFPDSDIAKNFKCGRTKTRKLVGTLAQKATTELEENLKSRPFSLSTDGSNDKGSEQLYPIVVRYHDDRKVVTDVLSVVTPQGNSTGENIFKALDTELKSHGLSWDNCISFGADNASVMMGHLNGVAAYITKENPSVYIQGCPCHLLHIAAKKGSESLHCPLESILIEIFHYLENSTKRQKELQKFQLEAGTALRKIIKHGPTRWLSLHNCVQRLLEQWDSLTAFFESEKSTTATTRLQRISKFFEDPASKLYALFIQFALPKFINANLMLQKEEPVIHLMRRRLHEVATDIMVAFIKPSAITKCDDIYSLEHHRRSRQKERDEIHIGQDTRKYLESMKGNGLTNSAITTFFGDVRSFYSSSLGYMLSKLPMQQDALEHAEVLDVNLRTKTSVSSIRYWCNLFPCLSPQDGLDRLEQEFSKFQIDTLSQLDTTIRIDILWQQISTLRNDTGDLKYPALSCFMKSLCALPHSNADSERVFSLIRKNKTESRASMSRQLINDITIQKMKMLARDECCHSVEFSTAFLTRAKKQFLQ